MDLSYRTPLVDCFRRGEMPREVRLLAARGALAPRAHEQLLLLMLLVADADPEVVKTAEATLEKLPRPALTAFLARSDVARETKDFFIGRGISPAPVASKDADDPLFEEARPEGSPTTGDGGAGDGEGDSEASGARQSTATRLVHLSVTEKVKVAMLGTREERAILVRDPHRLVAASVLSSPKLTESEVEAIARMGSVSDEVLRIIGTTRHWIKNYNVIAALTRNAKTPIAISLNLMNRLQERDLRMLSTDRNVPEAVRISARKLYVHGEARRQ